MGEGGGERDRERGGMGRRGRGMRAIRGISGWDGDVMRDDIRNVKVKTYG